MWRVFSLKNISKADTERDRQTRDEGSVQSSCDANNRDAYASVECEKIRVCWEVAAVDADVVADVVADADDVVDADVVVENAGSPI